MQARRQLRPDDRYGSNILAVGRVVYEIVVDGHHSLLRRAALRLRPEEAERGDPLVRTHVELQPAHQILALLDADAELVE